MMLQHISQQKQTKSDDKYPPTYLFHLILSITDTNHIAKNKQVSKVSIKNCHPARFNTK
jgi:hypothetical protein